MKKTLLALAAVAASSAAFAQSSVTVYGVVDASLESVKGIKSDTPDLTTATRVSSDNLASSRFGLKGTEDLGGGLKANFVLENNVKPDTGAQGNAARFFDRAAWVGVAGGFGELRIGRQDSAIGLLAGNSAILGAQAYDDLKIAKTFSGDTYRRVDNAITYVLPQIVDGLSAQFQYSAAAGSSSTAGTEASNKVDSNYGLNVQYAANGVSAGVGYIQAKQATTSDDTGWLAYIGYDFGVAKLTGYLEQDERDSAAEKLQVLGARVDVPVSKDFKLQASYSQVKDATKAVNAKDDIKILALKGIYSLSKRTSLYALFTNVKNDTGIGKLIGGDDAGALANGSTARGLAIGVSHKF